MAPPGITSRSLPNPFSEFKHSAQESRGFDTLPSRPAVNQEFLAERMQWAFAERVSTGLYMLWLGDPYGERLLAVASAWTGSEPPVPPLCSAR